MTPKDPLPRTREEGQAGLHSPGTGTPFFLADLVGSSPAVAGGNGARALTDTREASLEDARGGEEALCGKVSALLEGGRYRDAELLLTRGLEIYPESVDLLKELGVLYHLQGRFGKAARTFTRVMNITGNGKQSLSWKIASLSHKARAELAGPDPGASLATFDEILVLDPSDPDAWAGKIAALRALGNLGEADDLVREWSLLDRPGPPVDYEEGWLRMDEDRPDLALEAFGRAALAAPDWADPVLSQALAMARLGRGAEGEALIRGFLAGKRGETGLEACLGWFLLSLRDLGKAKDIFLQLAREDGDPAGFQGLASLLLATGRTREAGVIMERLADAFPRDPLIQANHGMVLLREGGARNLADAAIAAKRALTLDPRCAAACSCLGFAALASGRLDEAEGHLGEASRLGDPAGPRNEGLLSCARGRWDMAGPVLTQATRADPVDARAWAGLGAVALGTGRLGDAVSHLRRACTLDPWNASAACGLAVALGRQGDSAGAEEAIRRALGTARGAGQGKLLLELAVVFVARGRRGLPGVLDDDARQALGEAAALLPGDPAVSFYQGVVEGRLGNLKEAVDRFSSSVGREEFRVPAHENIRRLRARSRPANGLIPQNFPARSALAAFLFLQLAAIWLSFVVRLVSETGFVLLTAILSGLIALTILAPARNGARAREAPPDLVIPERTFHPAPEADMVSPFIRLRRSIRP